VSEYNIHLSPIMAVRLLAVAPGLHAPPSAVKVNHILELHQPLALGTYENQWVRHETNAIGLVQREPARVDFGLVLMVQECRIEALLRENLRIRPATHSAIMPILYKLSQQFE
jgi:hypothetical protein